MLRDEDLPPLPPVWWVYNNSYTADQVREYGRAVEQAAYLHAAALCDRFAERQMHPAEYASAIRAMAKG